MTDRTDELKREWDERSERLGSTQRAVLFKRFPGWLNQSIHRKHVSFVVENCPPGLSSILDVGCGYGRISMELLERFPQVRFQGVDLSTEFARHYEQKVGSCFNGAIQDFRSDERFDLVLIVTTLMYLNTREHAQVLRRLWSYLKPGGRIVCIEPASELFVNWRRLTGKESASPTGGTIEHFSKQDLADTFAGLDRGTLVDSRSVTLLPFVTTSAVHHAIAIEKEAGE